MIISMRYHTYGNISKVAHNKETTGMNEMVNLGRLWNNIQTWFFPMLED